MNVVVATFASTLILNKASCPSTLSLCPARKNERSACLLQEKIPVSPHERKTIYLHSTFLSLFSPHLSFPLLTFTLFHLISSPEALSGLAVQSADPFIPVYQASHWLSNWMNVAVHLP